MTRLRSFCYQPARDRRARGCTGDGVARSASPFFRGLFLSLTCLFFPQRQGTTSARKLRRYFSMASKPMRIMQWHELQMRTALGRLRLRRHHEQCSAEPAEGDCGYDPRLLASGSFELIVEHVALGLPGGLYSSTSIAKFWSRLSMVLL